MKVTSEDFKNYTDWQRYILRTHPVIPKDCRRPVLIGFCLALATHGTQGLDCYAGDSCLSAELGINRKYLSKYRRLVVELEWFVPSGRKVNRVESLDIAIPRIQRDAAELADDAERVSAVTVSTGQPGGGYAYEGHPQDDPWADDSAA
jgi:hypothetical protein